MTKEHQFVSSRSRRIACPLARWQLLLVALATVFGSRAYAQATPPATTGPSQPFFAPPPPEGFDPVVASDGRGRGAVPEQQQHQPKLGLLGQHLPERRLDRRTSRLVSCSSRLPCGT
jgi:hypothetical protein